MDLSIPARTAIARARPTIGKTYLGHDRRRSCAMRTSLATRAAGVRAARCSTCRTQADARLYGSRSDYDGGPTGRSDGESLVCNSKIGHDVPSGLENNPSDLPDHAFLIKGPPSCTSRGSGSSGGSTVSNLHFCFRGPSFRNLLRRSLILTGGFHLTARVQKSRTVPAGVSPPSSHARARRRSRPRRGSRRVAVRRDLLHHVVPVRG